MQLCPDNWLRECAFTPGDPPCGKPWYEHWEMQPGHRWRIDPTTIPPNHDLPETFQMFAEGASADDTVEDW